MKFENCLGCRTQNDEVIEFSTSFAKFNIKLATEIANDGREPIEVSVNDLKNLLKKENYKEPIWQHVFHVDLSKPIILATMEGKSFPIDGVHRIERAHREKQKTIMAIILTEEETNSIIKTGYELKG